MPLGNTANVSKGTRHLHPGCDRTQDEQARNGRKKSTETVPWRAAANGRTASRLTVRTASTRYDLPDTAPCGGHGAPPKTAAAKQGEPPMQRKRLSKDDLVDRIRDGLDKKGWEITKRAPRAMVDEMAEVASTELVECGEFAVPRARTPTDRTAPATAGTEPGNRRANHDPRAEGDQGAAGQEPPRPGRRTGLAGRGRANPAELKRARLRSRARLAQEPEHPPARLLHSGRRRNRDDDAPERRAIAIRKTPVGRVTEPEPTGPAVHQICAGTIRAGIRCRHRVTGGCKRTRNTEKPDLSAVARKSVILDGTSTTTCRGCMSEHRRQEPVWTSVRGAGVKAVSPADRGRSEATRLDVGEHTRTLLA